MKSIALLAFLASVSVQATSFVGFNADENIPEVPSNDPNLIVEKVWDLEFMNPGLMLKFIPGTNHVLLVTKTGFIRFYDSIDSDVEDYVEVIDMRPEVFSFGDHGMMSIEFHPDWASGTHKLFVLYTGEPKDVSQLPNNAAVTPIRPPEWGLGPPDTTGYTWLDDCRNLDVEETGSNRNGVICEHPYYLDRLDFDMSTFTAINELTLVSPVCGSSSSHGPGHLTLVGNDIVFGSGDGSQFAELDYGWEDDGCYDPSLPGGQGTFRAIRPEFGNGKIMKLPYELLDSPTPITKDDLVFLAIGVRQPFRMFYREEADTLYIGDVGFGDAGTSERVFTISDISTIMPEERKNFGWPCMEGVRRSILGEIDFLDSSSEYSRMNWLTKNGYDYCDATYSAMQAYADGTDLPDGADPYWSPPDFEYRVGSMDSDFPDLCNDLFGALSSVFFYNDVMLPNEYINKFMISDYAKQCTWYFEADEATGEPNMTKLPKTLLTGAGFVHMTTGPDGYLYGIDFTNYRLLRLSMAGAGDMTVAPTPIPTVTPTAAPTSEPLVDTAISCHNPSDMPEFKWTRLENGEYEGELSLDVVRLELEDGYMRTFGYNGMIPGPVMRMKPCSTYNLYLTNNIVGWDEGATGPMNAYHSTTDTNLHLHGLHISGMEPGDYVFSTTQSGDTSLYTYVIPCDHVGGTYWYHPHNHGASSLQLSGGAAGMLVVESNPYAAQDMPLKYDAMPEQAIVIQDIDPDTLNVASVAAKGNVFKTNIAAPFTMINGCETAEIIVEEGQWMRLRMLHAGMLFNAQVYIQTADIALAQCDVGLLALDGVDIPEVPRMLGSGNNMFFTPSSRVDIAIRCNEAGVVHNINYLHIADPSMTVPRVIGKITVIQTTKPAADDLPVWEPCRPGYLMDLNSLPTADLENFSIEVRQTINGYSYEGPDTIFHSMKADEVQIWTISDAGAHPSHLHINHWQVDTTNDSINFDEVPDWLQGGEWIDSYSGPGTALLRIKAADFIGPMVFHCHIIPHEDLGMMVVMEVTGDGADAETLVGISEDGTCPLNIDDSLPYGDVAVTVPGFVEAEEYDLGGEGVAYHNVNYPTFNEFSMRTTEAVEIYTDGTVTYVSDIRSTEYLRYTINVETSGEYQVFIRQSSVDLEYGLNLSIWLDTAFCPAPNTAKGFMGNVSEPTYAGTNSLETYSWIKLSDTVTIDEGEHSFIVCFDDDANMRVDKYLFKLME